MAASLSSSILLSRNGVSLQFSQTKRPQFHSPTRVFCSASRDGHETKEDLSQWKQVKNVACGVLAVWAVSTAASPVIAAGQDMSFNFCSPTSHSPLLHSTGPSTNQHSTGPSTNHHLKRLPPLSTDPKRCEVAFVGNTIGQANGVYDKAIDLRFCDYTNEKSNLKGKSLAAALMSGAKFDGADMTEVVMSKAYAAGASFKGTNFSNAVLDRVNFEKANLQGALFINTVLSGSTFNEANLDGVFFEDTIIGYIDLQKICRNTTINEEGRATLGCR